MRYLNARIVNAAPECQLKGRADLTFVSMFRRKLTLSNILFLFGLNSGVWLLYHLVHVYSIVDTTSGSMVPVSRDRARGRILDSHQLARKWGADMNHVTDVCSSAPPLPGIPADMFFNHMVANQPLKIAYCFVPKAGCTFWKRAFYYIEKQQENKPMNSLFDIKKEEIHSLRINKLNDVGADFASRFAFLNSAKTFIVVREPYSRLFSAWVDKLFLPDFWYYIGVPIVKRYRDGATMKSLRCGHDVTFHEFLRYVADIGRATSFTFEQLDDHWLPISRICQTCNVKYDMVGRMEDFAKSRDAILTASGMDKYISINISSAETDIDSMKQNIDAYWSRFQACVSVEELLERLWTSFQYQGFIPEEKPLPLAELKVKGDPTSEAFLELVSNVHLEFLKETPPRGKAQRKASMLNAYKEIPRDLLNKIKELFHLDFALYGYDPEPVDIFG